MTQFKKGDRLYNNDPRLAEDDPYKIVTITHATNKQVAYQAKKRTAWIKVSRIFTDGKKRSQGYNYVPLASLADF